MKVYITSRKKYSNVLNLVCLTQYVAIDIDNNNKNIIYTVSLL